MTTLSIAENKAETDLVKIDRCRSERWQSWCSTSNGSPDAEPAPEGARSAACLKFSINVFRDIFQNRRSGLASLSSSVADLNSAINSSQLGKVPLSMIQNESAIKNAEEALSQFKTCRSSADQLQKYLDAYSRDKESTRSYCNQVKGGVDKNTARENLESFEQATAFHQDFYQKNIAEWLPSSWITESEVKALKLEKISQSNAKNYGSDLANLVGELRKECEARAVSIRELIQNTRQAKRSVAGNPAPVSSATSAD